MYFVIEQLWLIRAALGKYDAKQIEINFKLESKAKEI